MRTFLPRFAKLGLALSAAERAKYENDLRPFAEFRRELVRLDPDADWLAAVRAIARTPGGADALAGMRRATALALFPASKRSAIRQLCVRHRAERTLVFTPTADDAYTVGRDVLAPVITAETARAERTAILEQFRNGAVRTLSSARVLNEGVDVPEASVAIIAGGALGVREHVQRIGRVLRPSAGKRALVYELVTLGTVDEGRSRGRDRRRAPV